MENKDSCPQCAGSLAPGSSRLVHDSCGHRKCRLCLLNDENCCKQCKQEAMKSEELIDCHTAVITYQKKTNETDSTVDKELEEICAEKEHATIKCINKISALSGIKKPSHVTYNEKNQEYNCQLCRRSFTAKSQLRYHLYCNGDKKPFECDICKKEFVAKSHYTTHLLSHQNLRPYTCTTPNCGKTFYEKSKLNRHRLTHATVRPFVCSECGKTFKIKENLRTHSLIHKNEKPYSCIECGLKFSHSSNLKKHLAVHTSDKTHMCDQCGKCFKLKWALTLHRRSHSKTRPNKCTQCQKSFVHSKDLVRHELIHAETKGFRCGICGITFKRKDNLNRHTRNSHPGEKVQIVKCVDSPNAIKVITAQAVVNSDNQDDEVPLKQATPDNLETSVEARQLVNVPLKLAFKTPHFKNHFDINRDESEQGKVSIYEKIMMPRSPALRPSISTSLREKEQEASNIVCQKILAPFNAPSHYETSFDNMKHAVIKNIKFKLPDKYTNLNSRVANIIANDGANKNIRNDSEENKTSVIVNSSCNQLSSLDNSYVNSNQLVELHWRKRTSQAAD